MNQPLPLVDTHCHLDEEAFDVDRAEVIARAQSESVSPILTIGTTADSSRRAVEIASIYPSVYAAVGIQPNYVAQAGHADWDSIVELSQAPRVLAIGETGLDRYWDHSPFDLQVEYFRRHLELARQRALPFVVHCREAEADTVAELRRAAAAGPLRGVMHSFAGSIETARECLELGLFISFAGMVTFKKSQALREVMQEIPGDRILIETDAPYLAPQPVRGKRNEPSFVRMTNNILAELRGVTREELAKQTYDNAHTLFRFPTAP